MPKKQSAFTIVELLVVIVVIGIIATVTATAFSGVQATARDAQRVADVGILRNKLELFYAKNGTYPTPEQVTCGGFGGTSTGFSKRPYANYLQPILEISSKNTMRSPSQEKDLQADPSNEDNSCYYHGLDQCEISQPLSTGGTISYRTTDLYQYCTLRRNGASWSQCYGNVTPTERCDYFAIIFNLEVGTPKSTGASVSSRTDFVEMIKQ